MIFWYQVAEVGSAEGLSMWPTDKLATCPEFDPDFVQ